MRPMIRLVPALIAAFTLAPALAQDRCHWRAVAWQDDRAAIETGLESARAFAGEFSPVNADIRIARGLLDRARSPQKLGDIAGAWQVRSIQVHDDFAYAYPYFKARIGRDRCGWTFAKTSGSQRRSGVLRSIAGEQHALAFLGGAYVNDDPVLAYSRIANRNVSAGADSDTSGRLVRIGLRELLMILDVDPSRGAFELYHLRR